MAIVTKLLVFILVFAICIVIKYTTEFALCIWKERRFEKERWQYIVLGCAISYIMTIICTGFSVI